MPVLSHHQMSPIAGEAMDGAEGVFLESSSAHQGFWKALPEVCPSQEVNSLGLTYECLSELFQETVGGEAFQKAQKDKGINSKPLRRNSHVRSVTPASGPLCRRLLLNSISNAELFSMFFF